MSEPKFTPGPWGVVRDERGNPRVQIRQGPDSWPTEEDCHLIATAPLLYAELENAWHELRSYRRALPLDPSDPRYHSVRRAIERIETVLAKARGES